MWELKFYSRGGQGAVTAAKIMVNAAMLDGKFAQAIPSYGQERKGAPVYAFARIADENIEAKSYVYEPNCVLCFDTSLPSLGVDIFAGIVPGATLVVNSPKKCFEHENFEKIVFVDADRITNEVIGNVPPNVAMLGALAKATGCISIDNLEKAIMMKIPGKAGEINAKACRRAYEDAVIAE